MLFLAPVVARRRRCWRRGRLGRFQLPRKLFETSAATTSRLTASWRRRPRQLDGLLRAPPSGPARFLRSGRKCEFLELPSFPGKWLANSAGSSSFLLSSDWAFQRRWPWNCRHIERQSQESEMRIQLNPIQLLLSLVTAAHETGWNAMNWIISTPRTPQTPITSQPGN